ncbi:MAG TPA: helix-turn-helix transcriptional regulator [Anaerolineae bacterium]|nr:helix-turn-helix transcriptional regulator [Anaerolineae bacterium]
MTNAELAILTLIAEKPRHGYEIEQVIEERGMREWTEVGFSSIYYLLKKLEEKNLIQGHMERQAGRGPARKVYEITEAGMDARRAGVLEALSVPQRAYPPMQLGLASLPGVSRSEALAALRRYQDRLKDRLEHVRSRRDDRRPLPYFVEAMFSHSMALIEAEQRWTEGFIVQLEETSDKD